MSDNFRKCLVFNWMHMIGKDFNVLIHYDLLNMKTSCLAIISTNMKENYTVSGAGNNLSLILWRCDVSDAKRCAE